MKNSRIHLQYRGACQIQDKIWFSNGGFNGLFSVNLNDFTIEYKQRIPFLEKEIQWAYNGNVHCIYDNKIFFFPYNCRHIMVCNTRSDGIQEISVAMVDGSDTYCTAGIIQWGEKVWIFPVKVSQGIFVLNLITLQIKRDLELENVLNAVEFIYGYENVIRLNETEIAILSGKHTIIGLDIQNKKRTFCKQFDELDIWGIRYSGSSFWLLLHESTDVYQWKQSDDRLIKYQLLEEIWINGKGTPYVNMIFVDDQIILLPCSLKYIMRIDEETCTISKAVEYPKGFHFFDGIMHISAFAAFDVVGQHKVMIHPVRGNMLLLYDVEKNTIEGKELTVTKEQVPYLEEVIEQKFRQKNGIVMETDNFGVELLDLAIAQDRENRKHVETGQIGQNIYNTLIRQQ